MDLTAQPYAMGKQTPTIHRAHCFLKTENKTDGKNVDPDLRPRSKRDSAIILNHPAVEGTYIVPSPEGGRTE